MIDVKVTLAEAEEKMEEAVMYLDEALAHIRAGKARRKGQTIRLWKSRICQARGRA